MIDTSPLSARPQGSGAWQRKRSGSADLTLAFLGPFRRFFRCSSPSFCSKCNHHGSVPAAFRPRTYWKYLQVRAKPMPKSRLTLISHAVPNRNAVSKKSRPFHAFLILLFYSPPSFPCSSFASLLTFHIWSASFWKVRKAPLIDLLGVFAYSIRPSLRLIWSNWPAFHCLHRRQCSCRTHRPPSCRSSWFRRGCRKYR